MKKSIWVKYVIINRIMFSIVSLPAIFAIIALLIFNNQFDSVKTYEILLISAFVLVYTIHAFIIVNKLKIIINNNILLIGQYETTKSKNISVLLFNLFKTRPQYKIYPTIQSLDLKKLRQYGFVMDLKDNFKYKTKFNIGFIDNNNEKYIIIVNQFKSEDIKMLIKEIYNITKLKPTGELQNILNE